MSKRKIAVVGNELYYGKIYRDTDWNEYVVKFYEFDDYIPNADFHTDNKQDAFDTARVESNRRLKVQRANWVQLELAI